MAVDESICRFTGRVFEVTTVPNKPTPTGIKIWNIGQRGFISQWVWYKPGNKFGPVGVETPIELRGSASSKGGNKTQAVVLHLLEQLPPARYHVYLDNLFTSHKLMEVLRSRGFSATGICRTNSGVISELVDLKKNDKGKDELPWGTLISMPTASGLVNQCGWKDNAFALTMSTVHNRKSMVTRVRKRPKKTSSKAKTARLPFGNQPTKALEIPELYDCYNHNMLAIDIADQLASLNSGRRRIRRGAWQALDQWLLITVLVNCYLVAFYSDIEGERQIKFRSQQDFRIQIIDSLLTIGEDAPAPKKQRLPYSNYDKNDILITGHHRIKRRARTNCVTCKGGTY